MAPQETTTTVGNVRWPGVTPAEGSPAGWQVGDPLPLAENGYGQQLPTPPVWENRAEPTDDLLSPPTGDTFVATISPISTEIEQRMGTTWSPQCPVGLDQLRYLTMTFWGFDGKQHTGDMIVNADVATAVTDIFSQLYTAKFPLESMRILTTADADAAPTGDGNNTAAFFCRQVRQGTTWSQHAYGTALDINPFQNPFVNGETVLPELASSYRDRTNERPGMIFAGGVVTAAFAEYGWGWGGSWQSRKDYQHFSLNGK